LSESNNHEPYRNSALFLANAFRPAGEYSTQAERGFSGVN
jgi:hypothetical protein